MKNLIAVGLLLAGCATKLPPTLERLQAENNLLRSQIEKSEEQLRRCVKSLGVCLAEKGD